MYYLRKLFRIIHIFHNTAPLLPNNNGLLTDKSGLLISISVRRGADNRANIAILHIAFAFSQRSEEKEGIVV